MPKALEEMSLEELWNLFPISLVPHNDQWALWYTEEEKAIRSLLDPSMIKRISHIGSTAIPNIMAKNIVDILLETYTEEDLLNIKDILTLHDWQCMSEEANRISLNKGYTVNGFADKVFHLHLRLVGDHAELYFRDYLRDYPNIAKEYERLKLSLWKTYEHDRDGYTNAKSEFITTYTRLAYENYPDSLY